MLLLSAKKSTTSLLISLTVHMSSAAWGLRLLLLLSPLVSFAVFSSSPRRRWHRPRHRRQHSPFGNTQALVAVYAVLQLKQPPKVQASQLRLETLAHAQRENDD